MVSYVNISVINQTLGKLDISVPTLATWLRFSPRSCSFSVSELFSVHGVRL